MTQGLSLVISVAKLIKLSLLISWIIADSIKFVFWIHALNRVAESNFLSDKW